MTPPSLIYRVVSIREGTRPKVRPFATLRAAQNRLRLLGPEPWAALGKDPEAIWCCSGRECHCDGRTVREMMLAERATLPPLVAAWIEEREVGPWVERDDS